MGDRSGVVIVAQERLDDVLSMAETLWVKEEKLVAEIRGGASMLEIDNKYNYESKRTSS